MPTPGTYPSTTTISFSQVNSEFGLTTPSPMNLNYRFPTTIYTPTANPIPTTPGATFPVNILHGRTFTTTPPFFYVYTNPVVSGPSGSPGTISPASTWTATFTGNITLIVIGGGGAGANAGPTTAPGGGGGGGGVYQTTSFPVTSGTVYTIRVGGGAMSGYTGPGGTGGTSSVTWPTGSISSTGGGGGLKPSSKGGNSGSSPQMASVTGPGITYSTTTGGGAGAGGTANPGPLARGGPGLLITIPPGKPISPFYCSGGGSAGAQGTFFPVGGGGSGGTITNPGGVATNGTEYGAGGGGTTGGGGSYGGYGYTGAVIISYP